LASRRLTEGEVAMASALFGAGAFQWRTGLTRRAFQLLFLSTSCALAGSASGQKIATESGETKAKFKHFVIIGDGVAGAATEQYGVRRGAAFFSIKAWTTSSDDAAHMARVFAKHSGFEIKGRLQIYTGGTISSPARNEAYGYAVKFYPYDPNRKD
jgi:hypothetical protein